jgi:protein-L-isoaspartate(D-aspartate) O-methyltransferase
VTKHRDQPDARRSLQLRRKLVRDLATANAITSPSVKQAFLAVPRELFVPELARLESLETIYSNRALVTKVDAAGVPVSSSSEPVVMAHMLEHLAVDSGHRVLEIGSGTGYNAALLSRLVGRTGRVDSIEIDNAIVASARAALIRDRRENVNVKFGDGRVWQQPRRKYDRIVVTASTDSVPRAWHSGLVPNGLLVVPLRVTVGSLFPQVIAVFRRTPDGFIAERVFAGGFMATRSAGSDPAPTFPAAIVTTVDGHDRRRVIQVSGKVVGGLSTAQLHSLLDIMIRNANRSTLGERLQGREAYAAQVYVALSTRASEVVAVDDYVDHGSNRRGTVSSSGVLVRQGREVAFAFAAGARPGVYTQIESHGNPLANRQLVETFGRWRARSVRDLAGLEMFINYVGSVRPRNGVKWSSRGECRIGFRWR